MVARVTPNVCDWYRKKNDSRVDLSPNENEPVLWKKGFATRFVTWRFDYTRFGLSVRAGPP